MSAQAVRTALRAAADPAKAAFFPRFFKAGPGEYAEDDRFLGVTVPQQRRIVRQFRDLSLSEVTLLIDSPWHEERLTGLLILVGQFERSDEAGRAAIYDFYLAHTNRVNNWDLVDSSAPYIVGAYLHNKLERLEVLLRLAGSDSLWERRIAMLATYHFIRHGRADEALVIAETLLHDQHDLIQKAVGWMLREVGKRVDRALLEAFLDQYAATMPRTALRYAIEHFSPERRQHYLRLKDT